MPRKVAVTTLNASTIDIINVIRQNSSLAYQNAVPVVEDAKDIPRVGEILYGYPAFANEFINALVNRIALVRVKSASFNNAYAVLKKGYLMNGETVEEVFVNIAKVREFSVEKAPAREMKRTLADVRSAFHAMNWRVQYPVSIQNEDLRMAFLSMDGVQDMIARIVDSIYVAAEYDEFLLFKYLMIKAIAHGKMYPVGVDTTDFNDTAIAFRGISNTLPFLSTKYNSAGVTNNTPKADQYIFMDAMFNAKYDVGILASAFNMDKADFMGRLMLIDDWTTFDNERWEVIREASDMVEEVSAEELALMEDVLAVLVDQEWFQIYDNLSIFTEDYIAAGLYWNYFYTQWKTVSSSPFSNAVVFIEEKEGETNSLLTLPETLDFKVDSASTDNDVTVINLVPVDGTPERYRFVQTEELVSMGVAVHRYGSVIITNESVQSVSLTVMYEDIEYTATVTLPVSVGDDVNFAVISDDSE